MQEWRLDDEDSRRWQHLQEPGRLHAVREHWQITQPCSFDLLSETRESGSRESAGRFSFLIGFCYVLACPAVAPFVRHGITRLTAIERRRYSKTWERQHAGHRDNRWDFNRENELRGMSAGAAS